MGLDIRDIQQITSKQYDLLNQYSQGDNHKLHTFLRNSPLKTTAEVNSVFSNDNPFNQAIRHLDFLTPTSRQCILRAVLKHNRLDHFETAVGHIFLAKITKTRLETLHACLHYQTHHDDTNDICLVYHDVIKTLINNSESKQRIQPHYNAKQATARVGSSLFRQALSPRPTRLQPSKQHFAASNTAPSKR